MKKEAHNVKKGLHYVMYIVIYPTNVMPTRMAEIGRKLEQILNLQNMWCGILGTNFSDKMRKTPKKNLYVTCKYTAKGE